MNNIKSNRILDQKGFSQILILLIMGVLAVALPITTRLVQQNQENRSKAASATCIDADGKTYTSGAKSCGVLPLSKNNAFTCNNGKWEETFCSNGCSGGVCNKSPAASATCIDADGKTYTSGAKSCGVLPLSKNNAFTCNNGKWEETFCSNGCSGGVCIGSSTTNPPSITSSSCSSKGGICVTSGGSMTSGIKCVSGTKQGTTNTSYSCSSGQVCCVISGTVDTRPKCDDKGGVCVTSGGSMTSGVKCVSGTKTGSTNTSYSCSSSQICCVLEKDIPSVPVVPGTTNPPATTNPPTTIGLECPGTCVTTSGANGESCRTFAETGIINASYRCDTGKKCCITEGGSSPVNPNPPSQPSGSAKVSFKFTFSGIKPGAKCISQNLGNLKIEVGNVTLAKYQGDISAQFSIVEGETDSLGNQVFRVNGVALNNDFANVSTRNYLKIKGSYHIKRRMCLNNQSKKVDEKEICNIKLDGTEYVFSEYRLLAGDIAGATSGKQDGAINGIDFSYVKTRLDPTADPQCNREGDLNADGVVNNLDTGLVKDALLQVDDE